MAYLTSLVLALGLASSALAQCGAGSPEATVDGSEGSYVATAGGSEVYSGSDYLAAIQTAIDSISAGQRVSVIASGSIGESNSINIDSGKTFEGCGTIDVGYRHARGAINSLDTTDVSIPYLKMTGNPYFGLRFYGVENLSLGEIELNLSAGIGIRFDRDKAANKNVTMGTIRVNGATEHAVETWNIDGLEIGSVIARDVGECGLLLQNTINAHVGLVDGDNVATGSGYGTLRFANQNGRLPDGSYTPNVFIDSVVSRGGGRGVFCVSESGGAVIENVDLADNGNNAMLIENCYDLTIKGGTVNGGGDIRISARDEFENTRDVSISVEANDVNVRESPCGDNTKWDISGSASLDVC